MIQALHFMLIRDRDSLMIEVYPENVILSCSTKDGWHAILSMNNDAAQKLTKPQDAIIEDPDNHRTFTFSPRSGRLAITGTERTRAFETHLSIDECWVFQEALRVLLDMTKGIQCFEM